MAKLAEMIDVNAIIDYNSNLAKGYSALINNEKVKKSVTTLIDANTNLAKFWANTSEAYIDSVKSVLQDLNVTVNTSKKK